MALLETMIGLTLGLLAVLVIVKSFASIEQFARAGHPDFAHQPPRD